MTYEDEKMVIININVGAVMIAAVLGFLIGGIWYSKLLFGDAWMKLVGMTKKDVEKITTKQKTITYLAYFIGTIIMAYVLEIILELTNIHTVKGGIQIAMIVWVGFIGSIGLGKLTSKKHEQKSFFDTKKNLINNSVKIYLIDNSYQIINLIVMSIILVIL